MFTNSLWWTFLANGLIAQQKQHWFVFGNEEKVDGALHCEKRKKKHTRCSSFWAYRGKTRLFFHLETFCLTTADRQPRIPQNQRGCARYIGQDCTQILWKLGELIWEKWPARCPIFFTRSFCFMFHMPEMKFQHYTPDVWGLWKRYTRQSRWHDLPESITCSLLHKLFSIYMLCIGKFSCFIALYKPSTQTTVILNRPCYCYDRRIP